MGPKDSKGGPPKLDGAFSHFPKPTSQPAKGTVGDMGKVPSNQTSQQGNK